MDLDGKKSGSPDVADGSLAYMPKPDGDEGVDEIKLGSKKEEAKTMADFADELSREDDAKEHKVAVKAEKPTTKADKPEPAKETTKAQVIDGDNGGSLPPVSHAAVPMGESEKKGGKGVLIALLLLALIAAGAFAYLWWSGKSAQADLQKKNEELTAANAALSKTTTDTKTKTVTVRSIPELGVTYAVTDTTKTLTYRYRETTDAEKVTRKLITFSSTGVVAAEVKVSNAAPKCTAEFAPLGTLTVYAAGDTYKGAKIETQTVDNVKIFKVGENYYVYDSPQAACSSDKTVQAAVATDKEAVAELIKSLKGEN